MNLLRVWSLLGALLACSTAFGLGSEKFGNDALPDNYQAWPGLLEVANHPSRTYCNWVNGHEFFRYQGTAAQLNEVLLRFADVKIPVREVLLQPGPKTRKSFDGKEMPVDWEIELMGGISAGLIRSEDGQRVWPASPRLTVFLSDHLRLADLKFPAEITLLDREAVKAGVRQAMAESKDQHARGWGCSVLADLDPYDAKTLQALELALLDADSWVQRNAAGAASRLGAEGTPLLSRLEGLSASADDSLKTESTKAAATIRASKADDKAAAVYRKTAGEIQQFTRSRQASAK